jgi:hypothetical protein
MGILKGSFKKRTTGTADNPLTKYEKQLKQTSEDATFKVKAGNFGKGSNTLSGIADKLGVTLKSLEKENPNIADLNKISSGQNINVPLRKQTFVEKYILGEKTKPATRKVQTSSGEEETMAVKKGSEGPVYKGMSKSDMAKITLERNGGAKMPKKHIMELPTNSSKRS